MIASAASPSVREIGVPELRHLAYRHNPVGQFFATQWSAPYGDRENQSTQASVGSRDVQALRANILTTYRRMHARLHNQHQPARLIYQTTACEAFFAWVCSHTSTDTHAQMLITVFQHPLAFLEL